ncbi:cellulose binding domain-containing protein [Actinoplanes sp. L3-i22]|uniref:cellulose binding domain-containing protein n=1 Tax=Actinoplanes sp. L3-i22 TaxID=2836373 RepID=UPI001C76CADC|nr:cellulose binding domain-containing protein [Actinoplanes sp. L3-i22]BCY10704.1 hypothetical protein L3i22_057920 [Actinoplanes sp. L3-i22]
MNDTGPRQRRSLSVVILDGLLRLSTVLSGPAPTPKVREPRTRGGAGRYVLIAAAVVALAGTALVAILLVRGSGDPAASPDEADALPAAPSPPAAAAPSAVASVRAATSVGAAVTATRPSSRPPVASGSAGASGTAVVPLTASYRISSATIGLLGYRMTVTVANPGATAKDGWALTVTLPRPTLMVTNVAGATATQSGSTWTFAPDADTAGVPADGSVEISFGVTGATLIDAAPQDCRVDGTPCTS